LLKFGPIKKEEIMKKYLLILLPLMFFIGCADDDDDDSSSSASFDGTWQLTFAGEYENANCSGSIDSTGWAFMTAFGMVQTVEITGSSYTMSVTMLGETEQMTGTFSEQDGKPCIDGDCLTVTWVTSGQVWSTNQMDDAYCEDDNGDEYPEYTTETSCDDAGYDWSDASCSILVWTKQ